VTNHKNHYDKLTRTISSRNTNFTRCGGVSFSERSYSNSVRRIFIRRNKKFQESRSRNVSKDNKERESKVKIVTVNIPENYIDAIKKLIGQGGLYPSRSELIRVAVREFLIKELKLANNMAKYSEVEIGDFDDGDFDEEDFVRVPIETKNDKSEPIREFTTYKILRRLEYNNSEEKPKPVDHGKFTEKVNYGETFDDIPRPSNHTSPSLNELRKIAPSEPYLKFINEM